MSLAALHISGEGATEMDRRAAAFDKADDAVLEGFQTLLLGTIRQV